MQGRFIIARKPVYKTVGRGILDTPFFPNLFPVGRDDLQFVISSPAKHPQSPLPAD